MRRASRGFRLVAVVVEVMGLGDFDVEVLVERKNADADGAVMMCRSGRSG